MRPIILAALIVVAAWGQTPPRPTGRPIADRETYTKLLELKAAILDAQNETAQLTDRFKAVQDALKASAADFQALAKKVQEKECKDCELDWKTLTWTVPAPKPGEAKPQE